MRINVSRSSHLVVGRGSPSVVFATSASCAAGRCTGRS